jgi:hypothetical protein
MQNHWDFLNEKLGTDVVKYIIQPMLMPSEESVRLAKAAVNDWIICPYQYHPALMAFPSKPKRWRPSWVVWATERLEADRKAHRASVLRIEYDMMRHFWDSFGTSETFAKAHYFQYWFK